MTESVERVKKALDTGLQGIRKLKEAEQMLACGPSSFYFEKLFNYVSLLFDKYAPVKDGDEVVLIKAPDCNGGWKGCEKFLKLGATGVVCSVDADENGFYAFISFADEHYISHIDGARIDKPHQHTFGLSEKYWEKKNENSPPILSGFSI